MSTSETNIHRVHGVYWDRSEGCLHLHVVSEEGIFDLNLFHDKGEEPEVIQATGTGLYNPAHKMAQAAAERLKNRLDKGAGI